MLLSSRSQQNKVYRLRKPDYIENRGERWLLVWKDIPHWIVVDDELNTLLSELNGQQSLQDIFAKYPQWTAKQPEIMSGIAAMDRSEILESSGSKPNIATNHKVIPIENITINITRRCNLSCKFCYIHGFPAPNSENELSVDRTWDFICRIKPSLSKKPALIILGGEPLLRADELLLLCTLAKRRGLDTLVSTNGTLITDSFAKQAAMIGLQVQVSLDGHLPELHDSIRGKGSFEKTIKGIETLVKRKAHTIISMVCHQGNMEYLEEMYNLAISLGVNEARFIPLKQIGGGIDGGFTPVRITDMIMSSYELFKRRPQILKLAGRDAFSIFASTCKYSMKRTSCGTGLQTFLLDSDGIIYPCLNTNLPEFELGNICDPNFDFADMWQQSTRLKNYRRQTAVSGTDGICSDCIARHWCIGGCRGETYINTGNIAGKPVGCSDLREAIIEMMWMISESPDMIRPVNTTC